MDELPTITLDTTVAELYKRASPTIAKKHIAQVLCGVNSGIKLNSHLPRNVKYLYQDTPFNTVSKLELTDENEELRRSLALKYLSLVPQRDAFISGNTTVILFNVGQDPEHIEHDRLEVQKTIEVLKPSQRPRLVFCSGPEHIPLKEHGIDMIACKLALDSLEGYPLTCNLDTHWTINSKAALALSGLPTPRSEIIELDGLPIRANSCCLECSSGDVLYVSPTCTGLRGSWMNDSIEHVVSILSSRPLPFVLKSQQTFGGAGTFVVTEETQRQELLQQLSTELLRKLFSQVTLENQHLSPGTLILSDFVSDPIADYGLTFFVTNSGLPIFLAVSEQMIDDNRAWIGSTINYSRQKSLEGKFSSIMHKIALWLHGHDYFGPAGADILETNSSSSQFEDFANLHIVDLNIRTSGSLCLPLLRTHFETRGLSCASSFSVTVKASRDEFIKEWRGEFKSGKICIISWYEDSETGTSIADVAVGGENESCIQQMISRLRDATDEVVF